MALYEEKVASYEKKLRREIDSIHHIMQINLSELDKTTCVRVERDLVEVLDKYELIYSEYMQYLSNTKSLESLAALEEMSELHEGTMRNIAKFRDSLTSVRQTFVEEPLFPFAAAHSKKSQRSEMSDMIAAMYVEAETAQAKTEFVEQEARLLKEKAKLEEAEKISAAANVRKQTEIESDLKVLSHRKAAAVAKAEVGALEIISRSSGSSKGSVALDIIPQQNPHNKVREYMYSNAHHGTDQPHAPYLEQVSEKADILKDMTKYLLKKDLILTRLTNFNDSPDTYQSWKASFKHVVREIEVNEIEEIDLLIKWLGPESRKHGVSLKSVYRHNPGKALICIWNRLDERYGSPEIVYRTVMKKLDRIPKLTYTDTTRWYDLADMVAEVQALKEDKAYAAPLSYFDSSIGISPIVAKLPVSIQEKWATKAVHYKTAHNVSFPPFSELVKFIHDQARIRNDTSLHINNNSWKSTNQYSSSPQKKEVVVNKTGINTEESVQQSEKFCPIHRRYHSLNNCKLE